MYDEIVIMNFYYCEDMVLRALIIYHTEIL